MMEEHGAAAEKSVFTDYLAIYETCAARHGLTVPTLRVLEAVGQTPGCTQKELCERLGSAKQRVNALVGTLEKKGLLGRYENANDGRSRLLRLTEAGAAVADSLTAELPGTAPAPVPPGTHTHVTAEGTVITHTHGDGHAHPHTHTKAVVDRLSRAIGHLEKVRKMVEAGEDCSHVLVQLSAVKAALNSTGKLILKDHIEHCLVDAVEHGDRRTIDELNEAIDQFIK